MKKDFLAAAEKKAFDPKHRRTLRFNISQYQGKVKAGKQQFADLDKARRLAKNAKWYALEHLERLLLQFEERFTSRGGKVFWAETAEEAAALVVKLAQERQVKLAVKSKSMVTEEIHLNDALAQAGIESLETDLGEYIVQLEGSRPYHIITPIMHKSKEDVAELFHEKFNTPADASPEQITHFVRNLLREKYRTAELGITGANFLLAETGSVVITENEGNARLSTAYPKTHIAIAGIEKIIPSLIHLELFLPLLATFGTGQQLTVYNSIINGARRSNEPDGPEEMIVILLDNGRTSLLADPKLRQSLYCIRCGACLNACPVYKTVGGHTYESPYPGPIGKVISPAILGKGYAHLADASSLCGNCTEVCPLNIQLHEMLLHQRHQAQEQGQKDAAELTTWDIWRRVMMSRRLMNFPAFAKKAALRYLFKQAWGERRMLPEPPKRTFSQMWTDGLV